MLFDAMETRPQEPAPEASSAARSSSEPRGGVAGSAAGAEPPPSESGPEGAAGDGTYLPALAPFAPAPLPAAEGTESGLRRYLAQANRIPLLEAEEERLLARRWRDHGDRSAAERLVTSHLRLVARLALGYRGYGLPLSDLVSEGSLGLLHAVRRFDPERKVRLSTYASWWIRAAIQEYILRSWSLVKIGSGAERKRLFFRLRSVRNRLSSYESEGPERHRRIAEVLDVSEDDVREMEQRLDARDFSLDAPLGGEAAEGSETGGAWLERIPAAGASPEDQVAEEEERARRGALLEAALSDLDERDRIILTARRLGEPPETLESLAARLGISGERVRQLERRAYDRLKKRLLERAAREGLLPSE